MDGITVTDEELRNEIARVVGNPDSTKLSAYVRENFAALTEAHDRGIKWEDLAKAITNRGIRDANGSEIMPKTLAQTYYRIARQRDKQRQGRVGRPPARPSGTAAPRHSSKLFEDQNG